jgi:hypothetical protein
VASPKALAVQLLAILDKDLPLLRKIDDYYHGRHADPYMPENSDAEYKLLASRAVSNWMQLLVGTPAQALYVDGFRPSTGSGSGVDSPEWKHWQSSRMDARQTAIHRGALTYGHSFTVTERKGEKVLTRGLSAMRTAAVYEDPANDITPAAALTVTKNPVPEKGSTPAQPGTALLWDGLRVYNVAFKSRTDADNVRVDKGKLHGASECPVTRFAAAVDLEGRTVGVVAPMIQVQDRINQTIFDLLVAQTYSSFKVRWVTGMAPPIKRDPETGDPELDDDGNPIPLPVDISSKRLLMAEDADTKFGTLDETPLSGYIESIDMSIRHLSAISQTPPHHLLGQIANLSADALIAAETSLARKNAEFRVGFGESWERVFRLAGELIGNAASAADEAGEVIWRDMESRSMAQSADALGKMRTQLGVPAEATWGMIPGVTPTKLEEWRRLREEENADMQLAEALTRATGEAPAAPAAAA